MLRVIAKVMKGVLYAIVALALSILAGAAEWAAHQEAGFIGVGICTFALLGVAGGLWGIYYLENDPKEPSDGS